MDGFRFTPGRIFFGILSTVAFAGVMAYLRLSFQQADVNTAIHLVESAKVSGTTLFDRMTDVIPLARRLCEAKPLQEFYGHMEVTCKDMGRPARVLIWRVNLSDGMVIPGNKEAERLGKGEKPWPI